MGQPEVLDDPGIDPLSSIDPTITPFEEVETPLDAETISQLRERCLSSLFFFCKFLLGFTKFSRKIHRPICKILEDESKHRIATTLPRGWYKSTLLTIGYPIWKAIRFLILHGKHRQFLIVQNTYLNATKKLHLIREQFERNHLLRTLFPEVLPSGNEKWTSDCLTLKHAELTSHGGTFEAAGIGTDFTGRHYDEVIEDDTVTPDLDEMELENVAPTKDDIEQAIGLHRLMAPLLKDPEIDHPNRLIVVGTRWFEVDLLQWIRANEPWYVCIERAIRETNGAPDLNGEFTWPELFGPQRWRELQASLGPYLSKCLYLNLPTRGEDMVFRKEWFQYYETEPRNLITYTTVDLAGLSETAKQKKRNDFNVVITCGKDIISGNIYVLDVFESQCNPSEVITEIFKQHRRWSTVKVAFEGVAYQNTMRYWIKERQKSEKLYFFCESLTHGNRAKETRIRGLQPLFANGTIFLRSIHKRLQAQLESFPYGAHDDIADALSMQLDLWAHTKSLRENREEKELDDPLSLEAAEKEIEERETRKSNTPALDDVLSLEYNDPFTGLSQNENMFFNTMR